MSIKLSTKTIAAEESLSCDLISAAVEMSDLVDQIHDGFGKLDEVDAVMTNLDFCIASLKKSDDPQKVMKILDLGKSCEELMHISADKIDAKIAMEGLGEAVKKAWKAFKEFIKKIWNHIKSFLGITAEKKANAVIEKTENTINLVQDVKTKLASSPTPEKKTRKFNPNHKLTKPLEVWIDNLTIYPKLCDQLWYIANESEKKISKMLKENDLDTADSYHKWLSNILSENITASKFHAEWTIDTTSGDDAHIRIRYTSGIGKDRYFETISAAGIKNDEDVKKLKACALAAKAFIKKLESLPDISLYMTDEAQHGNVYEGRAANASEYHVLGKTSLKSAARLHAKFFGLLANCLNNDLKRLNALCDAVEASIEET